MALSKDDKNLILKAGLFVAGYFVIIRPILEKTGLVKSEKAILVDNEKTKTVSSSGGPSPFDPNYWTNVNGAYLLKSNFVDQAIYNIKDAFGIVSDNYSTILNIFKQLQHKTQVSYLADKFQQNTGFDLLEYLSNGGGLFPWDGLSNEHLSELIKYANNLPE